MGETTSGMPDDTVFASVVLAAFPLSQPRVTNTFEASTRNDLWLVEDARSNRYVLTRHRQHRRHPGRVEFQLRFQQHLHLNRFPTAEVIKTRLGQLLFVSDDGTPWSLSTYVEGEPYDFQLIGQVEEAAQRLAQFHTTAESFPGEEFKVDYYRPFSDRWIHAYENQSALQQLFSDAQVEEEFAALRDRDSQVLSEWPLERFNRLPVGWTHGDYHGRNMVFVGDELRALVDFDDVTHEPLVWDIANAVYMFGREARGSFNIRPDVAGRILDKYGEHRPLSKEERAAIPMFLTMKFPDDFHYYRYCQSLGEDIEARLRREIRMMQSLREEMVKLDHIWH